MSDHGAWGFTPAPSAMDRGVGYRRSPHMAVSARTRPVGDSTGQSVAGVGGRRTRGVVQVRKVGLVDDLDGEPAAETVRFGIDGATYEIDLSTDNAAG